jgi:hypothetical protein
MKRLFPSLLLIFISSAGLYAQCGVKSVLIASKTEYINAAGELQRTVDENSKIEISKDEVRISPGDQPTMVCKIISDSCHWKTAFKEGKSILNAALTDPTGELKKIRLTIEASKGVTTMLAEMLDMPDRRIRLKVDSFEEKK